MTTRGRTLTSALFSFAMTTGCISPGGGYSSPYVGEQAREIKSLSAEDIAELKRGGGWGLARAAELNGLPGPRHVLDMSDELQLSARQTNAITEIFERMQTSAADLGVQYIGQEALIEDAFRQRSLDPVQLQKLLETSAQIRARLRFTHLVAHIETSAVLSDEQIRQYNALRGYTDSNPCAKVPAGHDTEMWRRHNDCD